MEVTKSGIEMSSEIKDLASALSKAQAAIMGAVKDANNPFFKSKYADLTSVWEACRIPLTDNGLSVIQIPQATENSAGVITMLLHDSGQWIRGTLMMRLATQYKKDRQGNSNVEPPNPQTFGSCITYARRFALASFAGVAPQDDDGNAASGQNDNRPVQNNYNRADPVDSNKPTAAQLTRMFALLKTSSWDQNKLRATIKESYGHSSTKALTISQYNEVCEAIQECPATVKDLKESGDIKVASEI